MDSVQFLLTVVLTITTILLVVAGIQLIFVLKEVRTVLKKVNNIVSGFEKVGLSVEHGFSEIKGFLAGAKTLLKVVDIIHSKKNAKSKQS